MSRPARRRPARPTDAAELAVLDRFEEVTKRPELMLEFTLHPGEVYFINNYTILHARTAFGGGDTEEDRRRHLLRLWLDVPQLRPVHPHIKSGGIEAVPGRPPPTIGAD
jgi:Taurine catabolism dioxygenase TauD, TfdA family